MPRVEPFLSGGGYIGPHAGLSPAVAPRERRDVRGGGRGRGPRRRGSRPLPGPDPRRGVRGPGRRPLHRGRERPERLLRPRDGSREPPGPPDPSRGGLPGPGRQVRVPRVRPEPRRGGIRWPPCGRDRRGELRRNDLVREGVQGAGGERELPDRVPRRLPLRVRRGGGVRGGCRDPPAGVPHGVPCGPRDRGAGDHEGHRGPRGGRGPRDPPAEDRGAAGRRRRGGVPRRERGPQHRSPDSRALRAPVPCGRPRRGRHLYLWRGGLREESGARAAGREGRDGRGADRVPRGRSPRMKVLDYVLERVSRGKVHMTLIDPDKQSAAEAGSLAGLATDAGTDAIMVGGSTGVTQEKVDGTVRAIKAAAKVPVILFPAGASSLSRHADAVYFMSLLNSRSTRLIVGEQRRAARMIKSWGLEPIPMAYLIVEPGMRAGQVGEADPISRSRPEDAVEWALAALFMGIRLVDLEAGCGAPEPGPSAMGRAAEAASPITLVVGGGIRTPAAAAAVAKAGAGIPVTGAGVEQTKDAAGPPEIVAAGEGERNETPPA